MIKAGWGGRRRVIRSEHQAEMDDQDTRRRHARGAAPALSLARGIALAAQVLSRLDR
jgi:hypothetical protein